MKNVFARNADGTLKTKKPCQSEGCNWPNWHVCPKRMGPDTTHAILGNMVRNGRFGRRSQQHRDTLSISARLRWDAVWEAEAPRDRELVKLYTEEQRSYDDLMKVFGISKYKVQSILKRAEERGEVVIRKEGSNIRWEKKLEDASS